MLPEGELAVEDPQPNSDSFKSKMSLLSGLLTPVVRGDVFNNRFSFELDRHGVKFNLSREVDGKLLNFSRLPFNFLCVHFGWSCEGKMYLFSSDVSILLHSPLSSQSLFSLLPKCNFAKDVVGD